MSTSSLPSFIKIHLAVLEKKSKMWKIYGRRTTDDGRTDDGRCAMTIAHSSRRLRWAKNNYSMSETNPKFLSGMSTNSIIVSDWKSIHILLACIEFILENHALECNAYYKIQWLLRKSKQINIWQFPIFTKIVANYYRTISYSLRKLEPQGALIAHLSTKSTSVIS